MPDSSAVGGFVGGFLDSYADGILEKKQRERQREDQMVRGRLGLLSTLANNPDIQGNPQHLKEVIGLMDETISGNAWQKKPARGGGRGQGKQDQSPLSMLGHVLAPVGQILSGNVERKQMKPLDLGAAPVTSLVSDPLTGQRLPDAPGFGIAAAFRTPEQRQEEEQAAQQRQQQGQFQFRRQQAKDLGLDENSPEAREFALTGKLPSRYGDAPTGRVTPVDIPVRDAQGNVTSHPALLHPDGSYTELDRITPIDTSRISGTKIATGDQPGMGWADVTEGNKTTRVYGRVNPLSNSITATDGKTYAGASVTRLQKGNPPSDPAARALLDQMERAYATLEDPNATRPAKEGANLFLRQHQVQINNMLSSMALRSQNMAVTSTETGIPGGGGGGGGGGPITFGGGAGAGAGAATPSPARVGSTPAPAGQATAPIGQTATRPRTANAPARSPFAKAGPYLTKLSPGEEQQFQAWVQQNKVPFDPSPTADYDMRGYWKDQIAGKPAGAQAPGTEQKADGLHFPDTYKTPYHRTFSNESKYAKANAPHWVGRKLFDQSGRMLVDESNLGGQGAPATTSAAPPPPNPATAGPRRVTGDDIERLERKDPQVSQALKYWMGLSKPTGKQMLGVNIGAEKFKALTGMTDANIANERSSRQADNKALQLQMVRKSGYEAAANQVENMGQALAEARKKVGNNPRIIQQAINNVVNNVWSDPNLAALQTALQGWQTAYSKAIAGGATSNAQTPVEALKEAGKILERAMTNETTAGVITQARRELVAEQKAIDDTITNRNRDLNRPFGSYARPDIFQREASAGGGGTPKNADEFFAKHGG